MGSDVHRHSNQQGRYTEEMEDFRRRRQRQTRREDLSATTKPTSSPVPTTRPCARTGCRQPARPRHWTATNGRLPKYCSTACERQVRRDYDQAVRELKRQQELCLQLQLHVDSFGRGKPAQRREAETRSKLKDTLRELKSRTKKMSPESQPIEQLCLRLIPLLEEYLRLTVTRAPTRSR